MKKHIAFLLTFFIVQLMQAQLYNPAKRDSLIEVLKKYELQKKELHQPLYVPTDTIKAELLWQINWADDYYQNQYKYRSRADELKKIAYALNYKKGIANVLTNEAFYCSADLNHQQAIGLTKKALKIREEIGDEWGIRWSCFNMGANYQWQNLYKEAMPWYMKSLKAAEKASDSVLLFYLYQGLSDIYLKFGNANESILCLEKSAAFINTPESQANYSLALCLLADNYGSVQKNAAKADSVMNIAKGVVDKVNGFYYFSYFYNVRATIEATKGNYGEAILAYIHSNAMEDSMHESQNKPYNLREIACNILKADKSQLAIAGITESKKYDEVIRYANQSLAITIPSNIMDITADNYIFISQAYEAKGDMKQAYKYFKMSSEIKDSLFGGENSKAINDLKIKYESEKKEQQISLLTKGTQLQQSQIEKNRTQQYALIAVLILVAMLSGVFYNRYLVKKKSNEKIEQTMQTLHNTQDKIIENEKLAHLGKITADVAKQLIKPVAVIKNLCNENKTLMHQFNNNENQQATNDLRKNFKTIYKEGRNADGIVKSVLKESR